MSPSIFYLNYFFSHSLLITSNISLCSVPSKFRYETGSDLSIWSQFPREPDDDPVFGGPSHISHNTYRCPLGWSGGTHQISRSCLIYLNTVSTAATCTVATTRLLSFYVFFFHNCELDVGRVCTETKSNNHLITVIISFRGGYPKKAS